MASFSKHEFTHEGLPLSYGVCGEGVPLVLLHGGTGNSEEYWRGQLEHLGPRYRLITFDFRGFGSSAGSAEAVTIPDLAQDLARLFDHLELERAHVAGLSLGGIVAQQFALDHPGRLGKLVLSDTVPGWITYTIRSFAEDVLIGVAALGPEGRALARKINLLFAHSERYLQANAARLEADVGGGEEEDGNGSFDPEAQARILRGLIDWNVVERLPEIQAPTLLLWGSDDLQAPLSYARLFLEKVPRSLLHVIEGAGHKSCVEAPREWSRAVDAFVSTRSDLS
jgi:pimeloyl-ACP methyl ester carboxylesterase